MSALSRQPRSTKHRLPCEAVSIPSMETEGYCHACYKLHCVVARLRAHTSAILPNRGRLERGRFLQRADATVEQHRRARVSGVGDDTCLDDMEKHLLSSLCDQLAVQSVTQGACLSCDYMAYHPLLNEAFLAVIMEVHAKVLERRPADGSKVLLATSLGLQAHRKTAQSQESVVVQKAMVVTLRISTS
ncbi:hypothetical protein BKA62DRAFT_726743 [Auriculariales sp. MPI-PUGE-AT-0066]|nr:hypothetical protein BKA62DRAFT_726743 [Auriculariales sp. MPI-PUGE-AT-0066]